MKIIRSRKYLNHLLIILKYIAKDKVSASKNFQKKLDVSIENLLHFSYKNRVSIYFDNKNIRDLIYKKYTIIYEINLDNNSVEILDIFNQNKPNDNGVKPLP